MRADGGFKFSAGNELWRKCLDYGVKERKFENPDDLLRQIVSYFNWVQENPLYEAKLVSYEGESNVESLPKMRATTLSGMCLYIGLHRDTWGRWRRGERKDLKDIIEFAESYMFNHKFEGAAAGLLNPNIIARDLGLAERTELTGPNGGPIQTITSEMTPQEAADAYQDTLKV